MYDMKELKIKLYYLGDFLFTVKVNGEEKEVDSKTNTIAFRLPEDADYEIEIAQREPPSNLKLKYILLSPVLFVVFLIFLFVFQELPDEWVGDIHPFLLKAKLRGNMREHSELNFYYHASRNIKDEYTKPRLESDVIEPYEVTYKANKMEIKNAFRRFFAIVTACALLPLVIFVLLLKVGLNNQDMLQIIITSVVIAATIAVCAIVLILRRRRWYKYLKT